ncbi:hypothetical protein [Oleiharenicola sp. Vm1]|uniref:hypothetical protein n=1 Tax=Oleiharenicola sp. Vm1 TaxID=3398393 RepID=UPI0039F484B1
MRQQYRGFLTLLAADRRGEIVAAAPAASATGEPLARSGISVADRAYFRQPMQDRRPFTSEVFRGAALATT